MLIKRQVLSAVLPATTIEDTRYYLTGIQILPDGRCVATDGHILLVAKDEHQQDDKEFPSKGMPEFLRSPTEPVVVGREIVAKLIAAMPKRGCIPILEYAQLGTSEGGAVICATDLTAACVVELPADEQQQFLDYARVLPKKDRPELTVHLAVEILEKIIKAAKAIQGSSRSSTGGVVAFRVPTEAQYQGRIPLDHEFTFNESAMCIDDDTICDHEGCGKSKGTHRGEPDGVVMAAVGIDITSSEGIEITGCAMPCRT